MTDTITTTNRIEQHLQAERLKSLRTTLKNPASIQFLGDLLAIAPHRLAGIDLHEQERCVLAAEETYQEQLKKERNRKRDERRQTMQAMRGQSATWLTAFPTFKVLTEKIDSASAVALVPPLGIVEFGVSSINGMQGCGKSKLAAALAVAAALGEPFLGHPINGGDPCRVAYLAIENLDQVMRDLAANLNGRDPGRNLRIAGSIPKFRGSGSETMRSPSSWARQSIGDAELVIVDTWTTLLGREGADEVVGGNEILELVREATAEIGASLAMLGHNRKNGADERGTAVRTAADSMVPILMESRVNGRLVVRIDRTSALAKVRCGAPFASDILATFLERGQGMYLANYEEVGPPKPGPKPGRKPAAIGQVLDAVRQIGGRVTVEQLKEATGLSATALSKHLGRLVKEEQLEVAQKGKVKVWCAPT